MRVLLHVVGVVMVMALAFWAYRENYRTQSALAEKDQVRRDIARLHDDLAVLRAEWAFLNRPERLRDLVALNFDRLKLVPMDASQFIGPESIDYAKAPPPVADPGLPPALADELVAMDPAARAAAGRPPLRPSVTAATVAAQETTETSEELLP